MSEPYEPGERDFLSLSSRSPDEGSERPAEGRTHAAAVVESLRRVAGIEPTLLEPVQGKDVSDHLTARRPVDVLVEVELGDEPAPENERPAVLDLLVDMRDALERADDPIPYVIEPIAVRGPLATLTARHSAFKSFLAMALAHRCHVGLGGIAGLGCEHVTALYVDAENGARLMGRRFRSCGIPADGMLVADGARLRLPRNISKLRELIEATGAGLVVLDALRRLTPGLKEDSSDDMAPVMAELANLTRELYVAILLLHHQSSKPGAAPSRGSSAIEDQADIAFRMTRYPANRLKLEPLNGKFRIDAEPPPLWLDFAYRENDVFALGTCEPVADADGDEDDAGAVEECAVRIRALADQVRRDHGWAPGRLAAAAGSDQQHGTFKSALGGLLTSGAWTGEGTTRNRLVRPADPDRSSPDVDE